VRGEFASISSIQALLPVPPSSVRAWIGDDAAVIAWDWTTPETDRDGRCLLLTADTVVAGVHADLALTGLDDLGWKAMAAAVSDIAAMGGEAGHALITVTAPPGTDLDLLYAGVSGASEETGCPVVGGDLTSGDQIVVTVAVTGATTGAPVTRGGARPGDEVWVSGPLGASAAGLRLLRAGSTRGPAAATASDRAASPGAAATASDRAASPGAAATASDRAAAPGAAATDRAAAPSDAATGDAAARAATVRAAPGSGDEDPVRDAIAAHARPVPKLAAGRAARVAGATAMIDVSDGLLADLEHLARASGVGLRLEGIPVHPAADLEEALSGGEDYALAFCAPPGAGIATAFADAGEPEPVRIGVCTADAGERLLGGLRYTPRGWEHGL
jgi:thiamine-monophosphate kinase